MGVVRRVNEEEDGGAELWVSDRKRGGGCPLGVKSRILHAEDSSGGEYYQGVENPGVT